MLEMEAVYQAHFNDIYRYLLALTGDPHLAEEITAETFFRALQAASRFRGECGTRTWLRTIAKNCFLSHARRAGRRQEEALPPDLPDEEDLFSVLSDREDAQAIHRALRRLPEPYQEVFSLRVLGELSFRQIGRLFGRSEHWACVTFHRAKEKIQKEMNRGDASC